MLSPPKSRNNSNDGSLELEQDLFDEKLQEARPNERNVRDVEWYEFLPRLNKKVITPKPVSEWLDTRSVKFDPIRYLAKFMIKCQKLHYSVPQSYGDIPAVIKYDNEGNKLRIYNMHGNKPIYY